MTDKLLVLVLSTAGSEAEARKIAEALVERRLAACVTIIPRIQSVYRWEGRIEQAEEYLLLIKTGRARLTEICAAIKDLHSYKMPECIAVVIDGGSAEYLKWMSDCVE
ncbi:MAG TPA: divalent-cation tolerance protein CutA [Terriglobales bacterium]